MPIVPVVKNGERRWWPAWLLAGVLIGSLLSGRGGEPVSLPDAAHAQGGGGLPQSRPGATREPSFEEELDRLHPSRQAEAAMCGRGSGSGSGCCCSGGQRAAGSGSGNAAGAEAAGQCRSGGCGGRGLQ